MGFQQHDSQEMLSILLETLHQDINSISVKPYIEFADYNQQKPDAEVSAEYWDAFKKRE
jgi:ubiquitin C-terminal hydrolase